MAEYAAKVGNILISYFNEAVHEKIF
jgi:hypothetical protein